MKLTKQFFENKSTEKIAKELLGKTLVYESKKGILKGIITETEYYTQDDEASHSHRGQTPRNSVMFHEQGHFYIYFTYGKHYCINIVTQKQGVGEAVLIRAIKPIQGEEIMIQNRGRKDNLTNGPAKLAQAFEFTKLHNGINLLDKTSPIYIEDNNYHIKKIKQTTRIGISKAKSLQRRFLLEN